MSDISETDLAPRIDAAVTGVAGVHETYSARPAVARAFARVTDAGRSLAAVTETGDAREVTVCIGVGADEDGGAVAGAVASAVQRIAAEDGTAATVRVRVARLVAPSS